MGYKAGRWPTRRANLRCSSSTNLMAARSESDPRGPRPIRACQNHTILLDAHPSRGRDTQPRHRSTEGAVAEGTVEEPGIGAGQRRHHSRRRRTSRRRPVGEGPGVVGVGTRGGPPRHWSDPCVRGGCFSRRLGDGGAVAALVRAGISVRGSDPHPGDAEEVCRADRRRGAPDPRNHRIHLTRRHHESVRCGLPPRNAEPVVTPRVALLVSCSCRGSFYQTSLISRASPTSRSIRGPSRLTRSVSSCAHLLTSALRSPCASPKSGGAAPSALLTAPGRPRGRAREVPRDAHDFRPHVAPARLRSHPPHDRRSRLPRRHVQPPRRARASERYLAVGTLMSAMTRSQPSRCLRRWSSLQLPALGIGERIFQPGPLRDLCAHVSVLAGRRAVQGHRGPPAPGLRRNGHRLPAVRHHAGRGLVEVG